MIIKECILVVKPMDIVCDICKESTKDKEIGNFHFATLSLQGCYGDKYDCEEHKLHFCIPCYDKLIEKNDLHPIITEGIIV